MKTYAFVKEIRNEVGTVVATVYLKINVVADIRKCFQLNPKFIK